MDFNYSFGGGRKRGGGIMLAAIAHAIDPTSIDIDLLFKVVNCDLCAKGVPLENGQHVLLGAEIPCEAAEQLRPADKAKNAAVIRRAEMEKVMRENYSEE